jgi:hypothetical protein
MGAMTRVLVIASYGAALCAATVASAQSQAPHAAPPVATQLTDNDGSLKLTLSLSPAHVRRGESVELRAEVQNVGAKNIFVCRSFELFVPTQCVWNISFEPLAHVTHSGNAGDCIPLEWRKKEDIKVVPFEKALRDSWISLPPGRRTER